jgi:hypothetical protein
MANAKNDKHKHYARFAKHCLEMAGAQSIQKDRTVLREMAAEWLRLADAVLTPVRRQPAFRL